MEALDSLTDDIERIRELGITYGLSDKEIDKCILNVIGDDYFTQQSNGDTWPKKDTTSTKGCTFCPKPLRCCWWAVKKVVLFVIVVWIAGLAVSFHDPTFKAAERRFQTYSYSVLRLIRIVSFPFTKDADMIELYDADCLITNPLFEQPAEEMDCSRCSRIRNVHVTSLGEGLDQQVFAENYHNTGNVIIVTDGWEMFATFTDIARLFKENKHIIKKGSNTLYTTDPSITGIDQLMENVTEAYIRMDTLFHAEWHARKLGPSQALSKLFPRPYFIPEDSEVAMVKTVLIDASKGQPYMVPRPVLPNQWYVQASGTRHIVLVPTDQCKYDCKRVQVNMAPGQILYLHDPIWTMDSLPVLDDEESMDQTSIAFLGSFT